MYSIAAFFTGGLVLINSALRTPCCEMLVHYCPQCGLRLLTWIKHTRFLFPDPAADSILTDVVAGTGDTLPARKARFARSPCGPTPVSPDSSVLAKFEGRYAGEVRRRVLRVDWKTGSRAVPSAFWDEGRTRCEYNVSFPDFSPSTKFHAKFMFRGGYDEKDVVPAEWKRRNASVVVTESDQTVVGMLQYAQKSWHVTFYLPICGRAKDHQRGGLEQQTEMDEVTTAENERRRAPIFEVRKTLLVWPDGFYRAGAYWIWMSCEGPLLWTIREMSDVDDPKPRHRLILLDGYDRLLASEDGPWSRFRHSTGSLSRFKQWEDSTLNFYGDFSERLVGEVVTSYVGLCGQIRRKKDWDDIYSSN